MDGGIVKNQKPFLEIVSKILEHRCNIVRFWRSFYAVPVIQTLITHDYTQRNHLLSQTSLLPYQWLSDRRIAKLSLNDFSKTNLIDEEQLSLIELVLIFFCLLISKILIFFSVSFDISVRPLFLCVSDAIQYL